MIKIFRSFSKEQWAWSFYDWANSAFATTILAGFFPIFFKQYYAAQLDSTQSTAYLGYANALSLLLVVFTAPTLGQLSDKSHNKKKILLFLTSLGAFASIAMGFIAQGAIWGSLASFIFANFAFSTACAPYDSLLVSVANDEEADRVSSLGYGMGYLGGGILFALNLWMYQNPTLFGLSDGVSAIKASFVTVGVWWLLFSSPILSFVKEKDLGIKSSKNSAQEAPHVFIQSIFNVFKESKNLGFFLLAYLLYNDGVGSVIRMAVDYGVSIGIGSGELMIALLAVQLIGFPATILVGGLTKKFPPRRVIFAMIVNYLIVIAWSSVLHSKWEFFCVVFLLACSQGAIQALSRSLFMKLIPKEKAGEFFGVYNLFGKFSGIIGSMLMGSVTWLSGSHRLGLLSIASLFLAGAFLLNKVKGKAIEIAIEI
ncbi:MAG: MFS transporter [bacterium]